MKRYEILCTPEQTRKALELGAPISDGMARHNAWNALQRIKSGKETYEEYANKGVAIINGKYDVKALTIPTAEQVIGFMQEQKDLQSFRIVHYPNCNKWGYSIIIGMHSINVCLSGDDDMLYSSRKEATLAAIDAALEYLSNKK